MLRVRKNTLGLWRARNPYSVRKSWTAVHPTLLIVDDDEYVIKVAKRLLGDRWDIETARSAAEAARILKVRSFDAILTDYEMPGQNGISLLVDVMRNHPHSRRVLFSGTAPEDLSAHIHAGVVHCFVPKPTSRTELLASLAET